jgi:ribA/ribD-fused uncharacterized protein
MPVLKFHDRAALVELPGIPRDAGRLLSNFSAHPVEFDGVVYPTVEHAFQAQKFRHTTHPEGEAFMGFLTDGTIVSPREAKEYGGRRSFRELGVVLDQEAWDAASSGIMKELLRCKIERHEVVRSILAGCRRHDYVLLHIARGDMVWGGGVDEAGEIRGENRLGRLFMELAVEMNL